MLEECQVKSESGQQDSWSGGSIIMSFENVASNGRIRSIIEDSRPSGSGSDTLSKPTMR
jgi:hypothetical protein